MDRKETRISTWRVVPLLVLLPLKVRRVRDFGGAGSLPPMLFHLLVLLQA